MEGLSNRSVHSLLLHGREVKFTQVWYYTRCETQHRLNLISSSSLDYWFDSAILLHYCAVVTHTLICWMVIYSHWRIDQNIIALKSQISVYPLFKNELSNHWLHSIALPLYDKYNIRNRTMKVSNVVEVGERWLIWIVPS